MKFYNNKHKYYCGTDLHAKTLYLCILDAEGNKLVHRNIRNDAGYFLKLIEPYREDIAVAAESTFNWYWLADLCRASKVKFVLGHAQYMKAIHGGKVKNDRIDSAKIAGLLRGGLLPQAFVYPADLRATRDLMRRRSYFVSKRAELLGHVQLSNLQHNLPSIGHNPRTKKGRAVLPAHFKNPDVRKSVEADLLTIEHYTELISKLENYIRKNVKSHNREHYLLLQTIPGIGDVLSMTLLTEIYDIERFPSVQDFASYSRLVRCEHKSAGKRIGSGSRKIGNVHLKWAFTEAAVITSSRHERFTTLFKKLEKKHGKGKAYSILAHKLGRAVYYMLKREKCFNAEKFFR